MSEYVKECVFCKDKIRMSDKGGKWLPYNQDGSQHDCKKEKKNGNGKVKVATIDGLVALDLIPHLGKMLIMSEGEIRGQKVVEVFIE